ncbi:SpoIIIAH-like family protein [Paenibacillus sp. M1]|uniref:SpoIIIAH-like family protein n=1 Tax=Paenibacillus haidiansis TaxID=1574488 RepID=A0ABU7VMD9_9BACL
MKTKRQTVWLVSMLSLMVILSAYYLFTEDSPAKNQAADGQQVTTMDNATTEQTATDGDLNTGDDVILSEVTGDGDEDAVITDEGTAGEDAAIQDSAIEDAADTAGNAGTEADAKGNADGSSENASQDKTGTGASSAESGAAANDEDVLKQLETQGVSAADSLTAYQFQRTEENMRKSDELMQIINDSDKTLDEAVIAQKELSALEEKEEKIFDIEEKLQQKYANAVVTESEEKYKVLVETEKLAASEAVDIMDLVIKELGISQDKVSVQYVTK